MRNLKLTLSYDGTRYQGFSKPQTKGKDKTIKETQNTICAKLTETLNRLTEEQVELFCGAKTEPGVHALAQIVNFQTSCTLSADEFCHSLNHYLPRDICVHSVKEMPERFHASLNSKAETYEYRILNASVMDIFLRRYAFHVATPLDTAAMEEAAKLLVGKHDFLHFSSGKTKKKKSTEKKLYSIKITDKPNTDSINEVRICLTANSFLYQMPRLIVGTLLDVGLGTRKPDCIQRIFACQEDPSRPCLPHGLYLKELLYVIENG